MATANPVQGLRGPAETAKKITGWYIGFAVLFIILGIVSIAEPMMAAVAVALLVGWLLIFGGAAHLVSAFSGGSRPCALAGAHRNRVPCWRILLPDPHTVERRDLNTGPRRSHPGRGRLRNYRLFQDAQQRRFGLATDQWVDYLVFGRPDLVPLALEFGMGNRYPTRRESANDWIYPLDVRFGGPQGR